ncbi:MAG: hypothetical protein AAFW81_07360 [Pseudomonadota bacterium]
MKKLAMLCGALLAGGVSINAAAQTLDDVLECRALADAGDRLACYDDAAGKAAEAGALAGAGAASSDGADSARTAVAAAPLDPVAAFGAEELAQKQEAREDKEKKKSITANLVGVRFNNAGKYIITLDNGQVWRQTPGDSGELRLRGASPDGVPVTIKRAAFGSYRLSLSSSKRTIRVERLE